MWSATLGDVSVAAGLCGLRKLLSERLEMRYKQWQKTAPSAPNVIQAIV